MKRLILLLIPILFLVGCDSTEEFTKTCISKTNSLNMTDTLEEKITYNNRDEVTLVTLTRSFVAKNEEGNLLIENIKKSAENYNNNLAKSEAIKIKNIVDEEDKYTINYFLDVQKMSEEEINEFNLKKNSIKYFNKLKKDGVECK